MTAAEFNTSFDLICDKVGSPYFSNAEKERFIMLAQYSIIDELLFPKRRNQEKKDKDIFEFAYQNSMVQGLQPLHVYGNVAISTATTLTYSAITSALSATPYKVINLFLPDNVLGARPEHPAKFVASLQSSNKIYSNLRFGNNTSPRTATYSIEDDVIKWTATIDAPDEVGVEFIKVPAGFSIGSNITCEVDPIYHNDILFRALQLAGIAVREEMLYQAANLEQQKES